MPLPAIICGASVSISSLDEFFDVQDELTRTIVATIAGRLEDAEISIATAKRTNSLPAYDCLLKGIRHLRGYAPDDNRLARELFEQAVELDPRYALGCTPILP